MIRRILCVALLAASTTACDKDALRLAKEARDVLVAYEKALGLKIAAEQRAYLEQSRVMALAYREQLASNLEQERIERGRKLSLDLVENQARVTRWREPLRSYAEADYRVQRELLMQDLGSETGFVTRIQALQVDKMKIRGLATALGALGEKISFADQVRAFAAFVTETKTTFEDRACVSYTAQLKKAKAAVTAAAADAAELKKATAEQEAIAALLSKKDCK